MGKYDEFDLDIKEVKANSSKGTARSTCILHTIACKRSCQWQVLCIFKYDRNDSNRL